MATTCCNSRRQFKFSSFSFIFIETDQVNSLKFSLKLDQSVKGLNSNQVKSCRCQWGQTKNKRKEETRVSRTGLVISCIRCTGMDHGRTNCSLTGQHRSTAHLSAMFTPMITWPVISIFDDNSRSLIFLIFVILLTFSTKWNSWIESCIVTWPLNGQLSLLEGSRGAPTQVKICDCVPQGMHQ